MSSLRSIGRVLDSLTDIRPLMERVETLVAMQRRYADCVTPELAKRSRVSHELTGTVFVQADSAAVAAKLRNLAPRILQDLRAHWPNLTGIQVGAQPTPAGWVVARTKQSMGEEGLAQWASLSDRLPDGPLKAAVTKISGRRA